MYAPVNVSVQGPGKKPTLNYTGYSLRVIFISLEHLNINLCSNCPFELVSVPGLYFLRNLEHFYQNGTALVTFTQCSLCLNSWGKKTKKVKIFKEAGCKIRHSRDGDSRNLLDNLRQCLFILCCGLTWQAAKLHTAFHLAAIWGRKLKTKVQALMS